MFCDKREPLVITSAGRVEKCSLEKVLIEHIVGILLT